MHQQHKPEECRRNDPFGRAVNGMMTWEANLFGFILRCGKWAAHQVSISTLEIIARAIEIWRFTQNFEATASVPQEDLLYLVCWRDQTGRWVIFQSLWALPTWVCQKIGYSKIHWFGHVPGIPPCSDTYTSQVFANQQFAKGRLKVTTLPKLTSLPQALLGTCQRL